jgi:hypothetical protein
LGFLRSLTSGATSANLAERWAAPVEQGEFNALRVGGRLLAVALLVSLIAPRRAFAYIDPLSGSIVLQVLAAAILAASLTLRKLRTWMGRTVRELFSRFRQ